VFCSGQANQFAVFAGNTLPTGILVVGIFIMMVSILGCCGARSENRPMLGIYAVILVILIICQFSIGTPSSPRPITEKKSCV
jgi:hypothetical protein